MKHRLRMSLILFALAIFAAFEVFLLADGFVKSQHQQASAQAESAITQLGIIDAAIRSGDQTQFDRASEEYDKTIEQLTGNWYFAKDNPSLLDKLKTYRKTISSPDVQELRQILLALREINSVNFKIDKLDFEEFSAFEQSLAKTDEMLASLELEHLSDLRDLYREAIAEWHDLANEMAVCADVCAATSYEARLANFQRSLESQSAKLESANEVYVARFGVVELVQELDKFIENS